jgi:RNA polymerase sigma-70 factor (sigma-E family)
MRAPAWDGDGVFDRPRAASDRAETAAEAEAAWGADEAVALLFTAHYRGLVRLAVLLVHDVTLAEDLAQDAYVALHGRWHRLRDADKALAYLRVTVLNRARSALRRRSVASRYLSAVPPPGTEPSAEYAALGLIQHADMLRAVGRLPHRQREAIVLRYYADLSEAQIAEAMGVSRGAVKSHTSRGLAALRAAVGES